MYEVGDYVNFSSLHWSSDWNGYEVGYPEINIVGLYSDQDDFSYYIDAETGQVLEKFDDQEDEYE